MFPIETRLSIYISNEKIEDVDLTPTLCVIEEEVFLIEIRLSIPGIFKK